MDYEEDVYVDILDESPVDRDDRGDYKGKEILESGEFERWDGGSVSGNDDSDHYYSRYRYESRDPGSSRSFKLKSVVEKDLEDFPKHFKDEAGEKGRSLSSRYGQEADSDEEKEEQLIRRHTKHESGDKEHNRNYRRRRVVDDDYSDEEAEEELFTRKPTMHGSGDKEHTRNYRRRRVVDDDYSDEEAEEELFTRKPTMHGSGDKEHKRNYRRRRVVDDDNSDEEEEQFTRKLIMHEYGDKQHSRNSKRRRVVDGDYSDNDFELVAKHSKQLDDFGGHDWHSGRILSRHHSKSRDKEMSEDHIERNRSRHRDDSHERNWDHYQDRHQKHGRERREYEDCMKERGGDAEEDNYKRIRREMHHSSRYQSEHDDEDDDDWETEIMGRESDYDYMKERGRDAKEEKYNRRRDKHHSTRYLSGHNNDDDDWERERAIMERERDYDYRKERGIDAEKDKYNRRLRDMRHSIRYQSECDDDDWEREIMERKRDSWVHGRERNDNIYEMKFMKREKDQDFRGHDKESLERTWNGELIERGKERDVQEQGGDCWEESREINRHIQSRKGKREVNFVKRDLRMQIREAKEKTHQREQTVGEKEIDPSEQARQSLEMSLRGELEERKKGIDFRVRDRECRGKSQERQQNKESKNEIWKLNFAETATSKRERETTVKNYGREKVHKVIKKKYLTERDITSTEDSQRREWDLEIEETLPKRHISESDSRKQDREGKMHVVKETDLGDHNKGSSDVGQEIERDRKTRQRYQKREFVGRDRRDREGRQNIMERDAVSRLNERLIRKEDRVNKEKSQERGFDKEGRKTIRRRAFIERDTWKPDVEIREKSLEREVMHKENERDHTTRDVNKENSQQKELLSKVEEKGRRECDKISHKKTLENDSVDNENEIDLMTGDVYREKNQQKEILNKEEEKHRREGDKISHEKTLENDSMDNENERKSMVRDNESREKCTETIEEESVRELQEEEKRREQCKETKDDEVGADAGTEAERQQKTVFAYQISTEADDRDLYNFFSKAGKVRDVRLVVDPISRHFIGVGYVEFYHDMAIPVAVSLSGKLLHGQPVMVKPPEADHNQVHSTKTAVGDGLSFPCLGGSNGLCVGNLHDSITETLLRQVFEALGTVELVQFPSAEAKHWEQNCIIKFARLEDARAALSLNGHLSLAGQLIKVSAINNNGEVRVADADDCNEDEGNNLALDIGAQNEMYASGAKTNDSNEEEENGMAPDGQSESVLPKLDPSGTEQNNGALSGCSPVNVDSPTLPLKSLAQPVPPSIQAFASALKSVLQVPGAAIPIVDTVGVPSECLLLKNMFDSNMQTADDFELRVKEDVEEKFYKYGKPKEIRIDRNSEGCVYLRFEDTRAAIVAQRALHGRWFSGKMITATYMVPQTYDAKFLSTEQASGQGPPPPSLLARNYGTTNFPINGSGQALAQGPAPPVWPPQTFGSNFHSGQQPSAPGPTSAMWLPNNNPVGFGAGFGNGGQFMQPVVPQGNIFPDMRPNIW